MSWVQELWSLLIALVATTSGATQQALYGVLLSLLMHAMALRPGPTDDSNSESNPCMGT